MSRVDFAYLNDGDRHDDADAFSGHALPNPAPVAVDGLEIVGGAESEFHLPRSLYDTIGLVSYLEDPARVNGAVSLDAGAG
jgi:hypothetical protein